MEQLREGQSHRCGRCGGYAILTRVDETAVRGRGFDAIEARARIVAWCLDCDGVPEGQVRAYHPFPKPPPRPRRRMTI